ncbi:hypothetical protein [Chryseobacterium jejuense]|uniref:Uncharacterized protein n=1 Tax=Chryseobacterium jejuense TaxID=445960 RepID=A0A2X2XQI5_CHRJE|nr:hypothetical protein [Chryseobacterium jejuense]SDJ22934.1 hypothetical protein SAMN05421542_3090 [Chryseobacterium jejuense]SQB28680.1 Uncharacterised protein [Chryseobacterium jejuense]
MYKEFGFWKEYGSHYSDSPSINSYRNKLINESYDKDKLVNYLNSGGIVAASSKFNFPHIFFNNTDRYGEFLLLTDGFWIWPEDLAEYVLGFDVVLPDDWYLHIIKNNYKISIEIKSEQEYIDWRD